MSTLTFVEKERMANFFGIKGGFVFSFLKNGYNKTSSVMGWFFTFVGNYSVIPVDKKQAFFEVNKISNFK